MLYFSFLTAASTIVILAKGEIARALQKNKKVKKIKITLNSQLFIDF